LQIERGTAFMNDNEARAIADFRRSLALLYLLRYALTALTLWAFVFGTVVLALRVAVGLSPLDLLWGLASLPWALAPAVLLTWLRLPSTEALRVVLDQQGRCGGLLMAGAEHPLGGWAASLPEVRTPRLRWRNGWSWGLLSVVACAFLAIGLLVPQSIASLGDSRLDVNREIDRLQGQLDALQKEKLLDAERAEALKLALDELRRDASGKDPVKTIEALEHVQDAVKLAAQEAAEKATSKMEEMARAEALAESLDRNRGDLDNATLTEGLHELAALARKALEENDLLEDKLDADTLDAIKKGKLTPEQAKKLAQALKEGKKATAERTGKLVKAKLISAETLKKCDKAGKCDNAALVAYLKENGKGDLGDKLEQEGKGGVSEDEPGKTKLKFGDESTEDGVKFKEEELPPSQQQALRESQLSGISPGAPPPGKEKWKPGASGALAGAKAGGGSARTQVILPRHKGAVRRYFERTARPSK
jgi:hypothetical protein